MGLFPFGKKDKKTADTTGAAELVSQPPSMPTPPKLQTPPLPAAARSQFPPPPTPISGGASNLGGTTQPMILPRSAPPGASPKLSRNMPAQVRSTQRIVLPGASAASGTGDMGSEGAAIQLPAGMILRNLPEQFLSIPLAEMETSGHAAQEVTVPLSLILPQLPSGKVELPLQDIIGFLPADLLQPVESLTPYLDQPINLPLMDVVMRIPPDLLALRPDQKEVDANIIGMADPFTEEILREQAEAARRAAAEANIIEENQVRQQEEFVPQADADAQRLIPAPSRSPIPVSSTAPISAGKPQVPSPAVMPPLPVAARPPSPPQPSVPPPAPVASARPALSAPPMPPVTKLMAVVPRPNPTLAPAQPLERPSPLTARIPSPVESRLAGVPTRSTAPVPARLGPVPMVSAPPPPRPAQSMPPPPPRPPAPSVIEEEPVEEPPVMESVEEQYAPEETQNTPAPVERSATGSEGGDDLARLAALAMAEMGDVEAEESTHEVESALPEATPDAKTVETKRVATAFAVSPPVPPLKPSFQFTAPEAPRPAAPRSPDFISKTASMRQKVQDAAQLAPVANASPAPLNLNTVNAEELSSIPGMTADAAQEIVSYRESIGKFRRLEELLDIPGMTAEIYSVLTGINPEKPPLSVNELLGFPSEQELNLKDVIDRIACWPNVVGCMLSSHRGLPLVGDVPEGLDKSALVAFAPRMFESLNKSFKEVSHYDTDELIIPTPDISYHILRKDEIYLIILSRVHQMPSRHMQVARYVLANLNTKNV